MSNLSVELRETKKKGKGLFATKSIKKGELIAYYKIKVFQKKGYVSPTNSVYLFEVYRKNGEPYKRLIGDVYEDSYPEPLNNITFWAPYANEPSKNQKSNSYIDLNLKENYEGKTYLQDGDIVIYKLVAKKPIRKGQEILWHYGPDYHREYEVGQ